MIPLFKPFMPDLPLADDILHSGRLSSGEYTTLFEEKLRTYFDNKFIFVVDSYSNAVNIVLSVLGAKVGDEVIASPLACLASTQPYRAFGCKLAWADVDPRRGTLSPDDVEKRITNKTVAIVHNHFCGYPGYIDEINAAAQARGIPVVDDGIECFGSEYKGAKIGCTGAFASIFSCSSVRIPSTIDGAIVVFHDESSYSKGLLLRDLGIDRSVFRDSLGEISLECDISDVGYSATMSNLNGYIGSCQMNYVSTLIEKQRKQAEVWRQHFEGSEGVVPLNTQDGVPNYWVFGTLVHDKRQAIARFREAGYYASGVHVDNSRYSVFGDYPQLPGAQEFENHFVALPSGWWME